MEGEEVDRVGLGKGLEGEAGGGVISESELVSWVSWSVCPACDTSMEG